MHNTVNIPNATKLFTLKRLLLCYMNFTSINYFPKNPTVPQILLPITGSQQQEPGECGSRGQNAGRRGGGRGAQSPL